MEGYEEFSENLDEKNYIKVNEFVNSTIFSATTDAIIYFENDDQKRLIDITARALCSFISYDNTINILEVFKSIDWQDLERVYESPVEVSYKEFREYVEEWVKLLRSIKNNSTIVIVMS